MLILQKETPGLVDLMQARMVCFGNGFQSNPASVDMPLPERIIDRVKKDFSPEEHDEILEILSLYGSGDYELGHERVLLAVLDLSNGNKDALWDYLDSAMEDYRDVLFWSEYPEESRLDTPEKKASFQKLSEWLGVDLGAGWKP